MEDKDIYILAEEANTYDTPNRSIEAGIFTDAFIKGYKKANEWISVESGEVPDYDEVVLIFNILNFMEFKMFRKHKNGCMEWVDTGLDMPTEDFNYATHWKALPTKP